MTELLKRIERLEAIEEIKNVQGRYYRCLDTKAWDELGTCFAPEFKTSFSDGRLVFTKWEDLRKFYEDNMGVGKQISQHNGHTPEITMTSETTADAKWYLHDHLIIPPANWGIQGTAIYNISYVKTDAGWKICDIGYNRIYEESWSRADWAKRKITEDMFSDKGHGGFVTADGKKSMDK